MFKVGEEYYLRNEYVNVRILSLGFSHYGELMVEFQYCDDDDNNRIEQLTVMQFIKMI
jgi:hypothetical protein